MSAALHGAGRHAAGHGGCAVRGVGARRVARALRVAAAGRPAAVHHGRRRGRGRGQLRRQLPRVEHS